LKRALPDLGQEFGGAGLATVHFLTHFLFMVVKPSESGVNLRETQIRMIFLQDVGIPPMSQVLGGKVENPIPGIVDPKRPL
jgi:hypothetical protein